MTREKVQIQIHAKDTRRRERKTPIIYTPSENARLDQLQGHTGLDLSSVVDLAHVDHLPATSAGDFLGIPLAHESLVGSLDSVHLVAGAADPRSKVVDTGRAAHFVDQVLDTETEA